MGREDFGNRTASGLVLLRSLRGAVGSGSSTWTRTTNPAVNSLARPPANPRPQNTPHSQPLRLRLRLSARSPVHSRSGLITHLTAPTHSPRSDTAPQTTPSGDPGHRPPRPAHDPPASYTSPHHASTPADRWPASPPTAAPCAAAGAMLSDHRCSLRHTLSTRSAIKRCASGDSMAILSIVSTRARRSPGERFAFLGGSKPA